ncbi:RNA polymerase sigma factor [Streptomyces sp. ME01-24h]|nr:RNA polymerase sigma factor [Streptomyces sp. ME01-24h]
MPQSLKNAKSATTIRRTGSGPGGGRHRGRHADGEPNLRGAATAPGTGRHRRTLRAPQLRQAAGGPARSAGGDEGGPVGYEARFERDVLTHLDPVYRAAMSVTGDPAEAEELVLEVFTRAYAAFPRLADGIDHRAWLYDLLAGAFVGPHPQVCVLPPESAAADGLLAAALEEFVLLPEPDARAALLALPKEQRFAVYLAAVESYTYEDIADIMDVPSSIAAYWLHDARLRLWATEGPRAAGSEEHLRGDLVGARRRGPE